MSNQAPQQSPVSPLPEDWQPRRYHWGLRRVSRGKDKQLHFPGQDPDERVRRVVHKHWLFLIRSALPFIAALVLIFLVLWGDIALPGEGTLWSVLGVALGLLLIATAGWFLYRFFVLWELDIDIITNKRIIDWRGGIRYPSRKETLLERVQQVAVEQRTPLQFMFNFGDLHIYLIGGSINLKDVPDPKKVKEAIRDVSEEVKARKPPKEKPPKVPDPEINALLEELGKPKPVPKLPSADDKYRPLDADRHIGPRRTFGGPLRLILDIHYSWGEYTVMYIQKSITVLLAKLFIPVLVLLAALPLSIYGPSSRIVPGSITTIWWFIMSLLILGLFAVIFFIYINYRDDVFILTNQRIIEIEREFFFFYEDRIETEYKNLRDIRVQMNFLGHLLDIGDVHIETPGGMPNIEFKSVSHPFFIQDKIYEIKGSKEKADDIKKENDRKEELHLWFGKVIGTFEQSHQLKGAPNLQNLDFIDAMERASELGFQVVVWDEDPSHPDLPSGLVLQQSPPPGTVINPGGEIQVVLSS